MNAIPSFKDISLANKEKLEVKLQHIMRLSEDDFPGGLDSEEMNSEATQILFTSWAATSCTLACFEILSGVLAIYFKDRPLQVPMNRQQSACIKYLRS